MNTKWSPKLVCLGLIGMVVLTALPAQTVHAATSVRYASPYGEASGDCLSWASACELTRALSVAVSGDQVWVSQGIHLPTTTTDQSDAFLLNKDGVAIYGGFLGNETQLGQRNYQTNLTVLSGDIGKAGVSTDNSYNVVIVSGVDGAAILDGFTITAGYAETDGVATTGAGVLVKGGAELKLRNLVITGNTAKYGAGMAVLESSSPVLTNVVFTSNVSVATEGREVGGGGGMSVNNSTPVLSNVSFLANRAQNFGGGMFSENSSNPRLTNVRFSGNQAGSGGGMHNDLSNPSLTNVVFAANRSVLGGGMSNHNSNSTLTRVTFVGNRSQFGAGMHNDVSNPSLTNVTFNNNTAVDFGGAIYNSSSRPVLRYVTIVGNKAGDIGWGGGLFNNRSDPRVVHSILWGNPGGQYVNVNGSTGTIKNSILVGARCPAGATCINRISQTPKLAALANNGGFTQTMALKPGSPAIDRVFCLSGVAIDQRGVARPQGVRCDIGAYEFIQ